MMSAGVHSRGAGFEVGGRPVGPGRPALLVAEIGGNHGGDLALARKMVAAAAGAGADAVKFQAYRTAEFLSRRSPYYNELAAEELSSEALADLIAYGRGLGLAVGLTVFDQSGIDLAADTGADFLKISSGDLTHGDLLERAARAGRPLFVSTGAATFEEVAEARRLLVPARDRLVLMQCAALYPAPPETASLAVMAGWLAQGQAAGYSDHTLGATAAFLALALGAQVLEKHFTTSRELPGGDNGISALPGEFRELARWNGEIPIFMGRPDQKPHPLELPMRPIIRRAVLAARDLPAGQRLTPADLVLKRPPQTDGILGPEHLPRLAGRVLVRGRLQDEPIRPEDLEGAPDVR